MVNQEVTVMSSDTLWPAVKAQMVLSSKVFAASH